MRSIIDDSCSWAGCQVDQMWCHWSAPASTPHVTVGLLVSGGTICMTRIRRIKKWRLVSSRWCTTTIVHGILSWTFLGLAGLVGWVGDLEWQLETVAMLRWDLWEGRYHGGHLLLCDTDSQAQHHWPGYWPTSNNKVVNSGFNCSAVCIASGGDYRPAVDYQRLQLQSTTMNSFRPSTNLLHGLPCNLIPLLDSGVAFAF